MAKETFYVSDLHVCPPKSLRSSGKNHAYGWFDDAEATRFIQFLRGLTPANCKELVLLGDIFDLWVYPMDEDVPTFAELTAKGNGARVLGAIANLDPSIQVTYVGGNHDCEVTKTDVDAVAGGRIKFVDRLKRGRLVAEHGHRRTMFNGPDPKRRARPLGYFISRIAATRAQKTGDGMPSFLKIIFRHADEVLHLNKSNLGGLVIQACAKEANVPTTAAFNVRGETWTIQEVMDEYAPLYREWAGAKGYNDPDEAILAEWDPWHAVNADLYSGARVAICGHSHDRLFSRFSECAYLNCGAWCGDEASFVYTAEDKDGRIHASLCRWVGKSAKTVNTVIVDA